MNNFIFFANDGIVIGILLFIIIVAAIVLFSVLPKKKEPAKTYDIGFLKENVIYFHIKHYKTIHEIVVEAKIKQEEMEKIMQKQMPSFETLYNLSVYFDVPRERLIYHDFRKDQEN